MDSVWKDVPVRAPGALAEFSSKSPEKTEK